MAGLVPDCKQPPAWAGWYNDLINSEVINASR